MDKHKIFINGKWMQSFSGRYFPVENPASKEIIGEVCDCGIEETKEAIYSAKKAFSFWSAKTAKERSEILKHFRDLMIENKDDLSRTITFEQGKPLKEAEAEVIYASDFVAWASEEAKRIYGEIVPSSHPEKKLFVHKIPVGVVSAITPWNFPAAMVTRKIAPALASGCTVVLKPAEQTPLTAIKLFELLEKAGLPAGVANLITTNNPKQVGKELVLNNNIAKISFTGSVEVGKILMNLASEHIKKLSLELGGNAPFIIFEDADQEKALRGLMWAKFRNNGQTCISANRIFIHEKIFDSFVKKFVERVKALRVGNGLEKEIDQGPLVDAEALRKVKELVEDAIDNGAQILTGGKTYSSPPLSNGYFFEPSIIHVPNDNFMICREEIFGPVACIISFSSDDEIIERANNTNYGLAAYFYTENFRRMVRMYESLEYGMIGVNDTSISLCQVPFGGTKESGFGREGGKWAVEEFIETKLISLSL